MPAVFIDTCCNLSHPTFHKRERQTIERAKSAGVWRLIVPASTLEDAIAIIDLAEKHPEIYVAIGIHPHQAKTWHQTTYSKLYALTQHAKVVAVGETGLDYNRCYSSIEQQKQAFVQQIRLAIETELPLLMHQRDAHEDFMHLIKPYHQNIKNGVVHCFTDQKNALLAYLGLDFYIGITGWFCDERRGKHLRTLIHYIPTNRLILETDSPYLRPRHIAKPRKGEPYNEPALLCHIAEDIAQCLQLPLTEVARITSRNSQQLYGHLDFVPA